MTSVSSGNLAAEVRRARLATVDRILGHVLRDFKPPAEGDLDDGVRDYRGGAAAESYPRSEVAPPSFDNLDEAVTAPGIDDMSTDTQEWKPFIGPTCTGDVNSGIRNEPSDHEMDSRDDGNSQNPLPLENNSQNFERTTPGMPSKVCKVVLSRELVPDPGRGSDTEEEAGQELDPEVRSTSKGSPSKHKSSNAARSNMVKCFSCPCQMVFLNEEVFLKHKETCELSQDSSSSSSGASTPDPDLESSPNEDFFFAAGRYQCKHCRFRSSQRENLVEHQKSHDARYKCQDCPKQLTSYSLLIQHQKRKHDAVVKHVKKSGRPPLKKLGRPPLKKLGSPPGRPSSTKSGRSPDKPTDTESAAPKKYICNLPWISCPKCPMKTQLKMNMMKHQALHKNPLAKKCKICRRPFKGGYYLNQHMKTEHGVICAKTNFSKRSPDKSRPSTEDGSGPSKISPNKKTHYTHVRSKKGLPSNRKGKFTVSEVRGFRRQKNGQFTCKHCRYGTDQSHNFVRHLDTEKHIQAMSTPNILERREDGLFFCHFCDYSTDYSSSINSHVRSEKHRLAEASAENRQQKRSLSSTSSDDAATMNPTSSPDGIAKKKKRTDESGAEESVRQTVSTSSPDRNAKRKTRPGESGSGKSKQRTVSDTASKSRNKKRTDESESESEKLSEQTDRLGRQKTAPDSSKGRRDHSDPAIARTMTPSSMSNLAGESEDAELYGGDENSSDGQKFVPLVTDFQDFRRKPYACALCFFRTGKFEELGRHCKNHLTGGDADSTHDGSDLHVGSTSEVQDSNVTQHGQGSVPCRQSPLQAPVGGYPVIDSPLNRNAGVQIPNSSNQTPYAQPYQQPGPWGPFAMPFAPGLPPMPPQFNPQINYYSSAQQGQSRTDDLIDQGIDYTKDLSHPNPYKCLYCHLRFHSFMTIVGHFESSHYHIVRNKGEQAAMRYQAAQAAQSVKTEAVVIE